MSINKKIVCSFLVAMSVIVSAMEEKLAKSQELNNSQSWELVKSQENSPSYTFSFSVPTVKDIMNSAINTFNNYWWDEEAFKKLGWPTNDKVAQQELAATLMIYARMNKYFKTRDKYDDLLEDRRLIGRRTDYCRRVLEALPLIPKRAEALELATFCLNNHSQAMNDFIKTDFLLFVDLEKGKSIQEVQKADSELAKLKIVPDDNALLDKLFQQTVAVKNNSKDVEQQKTENKEEEKKEDSKQEASKQKKNGNGKK